MWRGGERSGAERWVVGVGEGVGGGEERKRGWCEMTRAEYDDDDGWRADIEAEKRECELDGATRGRGVRRSERKKLR